MKTYPSIPHLPDLPGKKYQDSRGIPHWAFGKNDGSNIRVEWTPKGGFSKWGRRHGLLDDSNPVLKEAPGLFEAKYPDMDSRLAQLVKGLNPKEAKVTVFMELYGPNSQFGQHADEPHTVQIFDLDIYKRGMLKPFDFCRFMGGQKEAGMLFVIQDLWSDVDGHLKAVREGTFPGMPPEGIVLKSTDGKTSFKYKSQLWYDRLRSHCGDNEQLFTQLM